VSTPSLLQQLFGQQEPAQQIPMAPPAPNNILAASAAQYAPPDKTPVKTTLGQHILKLLNKGNSQAAEAGMAFAGIESPLQKQQRMAQIADVQEQTAQRAAQTKQMGDLVDVPGFGQIPSALAKVLLPAIIHGQTATTVQGLKNTGSVNTKRESMTPLQQAQQDAYDAAQAGNMEAFQKHISTASQLATAGAKPTSPAGKINPVVYSYLGQSPDPVKDPAGAAEWAKKAEQITTRMAVAPRVAGYAALGKARAENTPFSTFDANGQPITVSAAQAIQSGLPAAQVWNSIYGPTGQTKSQGQAAGAVEEHIPTMKTAITNLAAKGELGPVMGRINTYLTQGYGGDDPDVSEFITDLGLIKSGAVRAHFGARGGSHILDKFDSLLNTAQTPEALIGSLNGIDSFLKTYKATGTANPPKTGVTPKTSPGSVSETHYKIVNGKLVKQ
jgi:hypothetical protein